MTIYQLIAYDRRRYTLVCQGTYDEVRACMTAKTAASLKAAGYREWEFKRHFVSLVSQ